MATLFSDNWMRAFAKAWNADTEIVTKLQGANFSSSIAYGFIGEAMPRGIILVEKGKITVAESYKQQALNWDLRAKLKSWHHWITNGFGIANLGTAVTTGKLKFEQGDYRQMIRNATLAGPFLRHFELMRKIKTDFNYEG